MGLGAYLAGVTDRKHYEVEEKREWQEVRDFPEAEEEEIFEILGRYGIERDEASGVVKALKGSESNWVKVLFYPFVFSIHLTFCHPLQNQYR